MCPQPTYRILGQAIALSLVVVAAMLPSPGIAQVSWFPIYGDPQDGENNLVEVRPEPVDLDQRVMLDLRVSRDRTRTSFKGLKYRSYYAKVVVNCQEQNAWYLWLNYFGLPRWQGQSVGREEYAEGKSPVLFKDIPGQPYKRMISAACKSKN